MFEQTFKNIDDILRKAGGSQTELDYVEQTSWILFLKYLDDLEKDKETAAELSGKVYKPIIAKDFRWDIWAMPLKKDGKILVEVLDWRHSLKNKLFDQIWLNLKTFLLKEM